MEDENILDLAVIGGGLAGLSCAVRGRFVKSYGAYPLYTAVFEASGAPGGLANLGNVKITGPGFSMPGREIVAKLLSDVKRYDIPVYASLVVKIIKDRESGLFTIVDSSGAARLARTVAICAGMRPLSNEREFFGRGVSITCMGYDYIRDLVARETANIGETGFMIYGNRHSLNLFGFVVWALETSGPGPEKVSRPVFLIDDDEAAFRNTREFKKYPRLFSFGKIVRYNGKGGRLESVSARRGEKVSRTGVRSLLIDYNSFEISPALSFEIAAPKFRFGRRGFIGAGRFMETAVDGLFAAGDVTGPYFCASRAISDGVAAGFSAYAKVMEMKGFAGQSLFAYRASGRKFPAGYSEIAPLRAKDRIVVLSGPGHIRAFLKSAVKKVSAAGLREAAGVFGIHRTLGPADFAKLALVLKAGVPEILEILTGMICDKLVTIA